MVYDSGDYPSYLERARSLIGYDAVRRAQPQEHRAGRYRGVGVTAFLESTGVAGETARVEVDGQGAVRVVLGAPSQGQGHATSLAQICAARLGVRVDAVQVLQGDTSSGLGRFGTVASRTAAMAGNAVAQAAARVHEQALRAAGDLLEVGQGDLELSEGLVSVRGVPGRSVTLAEVARAVEAGGRTLEATETFAPERASYYAGGAHAAVVEVDIETGRVQIERYVVVHDCGTVINPLIVEGQVHGGVAHGVGNALLEAIAHDETGQILTASLLDYAMPHAHQAPAVEVAHLESRSPFNPEGIKGADALTPFGVTLNDLPLRTAQLVRATNTPTDA
jgi:CO/xanthine dehydrogenase Mo-binding subunit